MTRFLILFLLLPLLALADDFPRVTLSGRVNWAASVPAGDGESFAWDMESATPWVFAGDGTPAYSGGAALSSSQAYAGSQSLALSGTFSIAEFNTDPAQNPDFDFNEGTVECYFRWTGTWVSGAQLFSLKNELFSDNIYFATRATQGTIRFYFRDSAAASVNIDVTGASSADTWYKVTVKWRHSGSPYLSAQIDSGTAVTSSTSIGAATNTETQILVGNDTSANLAFFIDNFRVWKSWR